MYVLHVIEGYGCTFLIRLCVIWGLSGLNYWIVSVWALQADSDALSSLSQRPTWMLSQRIQRVCEGTNEDSVKAGTGKWGRSKPWSRNWSFLLSLRNLMQQLPLIIHKHSSDQSHDVVHFKSEFFRNGLPHRGLFWQAKLLNGWLLTIERAGWKMLDSVHSH